MQSEEDWLVMHTLHTKHGWTIAKIAREFGVNWRTARRYAKAPAVPRYPRRESPADLSPSQEAHVVRRLRVCSELRATTLYREVRGLGYTGSYPSFARRVRDLRPEEDEDIDPLVRFETDPGEQVQLDWADCGLWPVGRELRELHALVMVSGFSRMVAVRFATDTTRPTTLQRIVWCLDDLGGVPQELLSDRDPALVVGSTPRGGPVFAPEYVDLCELLEATPRACRPYRAQTKGKVERVIREVKEDFLCWATGQPRPAEPALADYDRLAQRWVADVVAPRRHRTTHRVVGEAWVTERELLRPLPPRVRHRFAAPGEDANVVPLPAPTPLGGSPEGRGGPRGGRLRTPTPTERARQAGERVEAPSLEAYGEAGW